MFLEVYLLSTGIVVGTDKSIGGRFQEDENSEDILWSNLNFEHGWEKYFLEKVASRREEWVFFFDLKEEQEHKLDTSIEVTR